ncbi:MAG: transcription elongation factor GreA [Patescibacteria group bacterium]
MADKISYMTAEGLDKLKSELEYLKTTRRRELAQRIETAKNMGDLSENAEYHDAKDALSFVEGRVREIEDMLKNASVISSDSQGDKVRIGTTVEVEVRGVKKTYKIVGASEANPIEGLISNESPLGSAFLGQSVGQSFEVETPGGTTTYKVLSIS